jgi:transposase-like protein
MTDDNLPETLLEAVRYFSDLDTCNAYMRRIKWPGGTIVCPHCEAKGERIGEVASRRLLRCKDCRKQFSYKVGTIFEESPLGLDKWFVAVWCIANMKNGISSHELARAIGVTQKSAWFMLHRVRKAMECEDFRSEDDKFDGPAEADATYVGGAARNMHAGRKAKKITGRGTVGKAIVHGVLQRGDGERISQVRATVVGSDDETKLIPDVRRNVKAGAWVYTDESRTYRDLALTHFHDAIDHSKQYVAGNVHVNGMENFWSLLKRAIDGTYVGVAPFHLIRYCAEQVFRFNERNRKDWGRFHALMQRIVGKRLTFRVLCGIDDAGFMGLT